MRASKVAWYDDQRCDNHVATYTSWRELQRDFMSAVERGWLAKDADTAHGRRSLTASPEFLASGMLPGRDFANGYAVTVRFVRAASDPDALRMAMRTFDRLVELSLMTEERRLDLLRLLVGSAR